MSKDWTGNLTSIFSTLAASNHSETERAERDYYATDPQALEMLLKFESFSPAVWENAVGGGHLAEVLKRHGYKVKCSDIVDRGYPDTEIIDFLTYAPETELDLDIVTNPPYSVAQKFVEKSLQCISKGHKVAMFLKLQFLEGKSRRILFDFNPPKYVYVSSSRLLCAPNGVFEDSKSSAVCYAWFVWVKGFKGEPTIRWFN